MKLDTILVLDFGGQYCHLIGRRVRELNVYSEVVRFDISLAEIEELGKNFHIKGMILSGGPLSVYARNSPKFRKEILDLNIPILGLCYGHQLIAHVSGGKIMPIKKKEYGTTYAFIDKPVDVLKNLNKKERVWMSHGDTVLSLPKEYEILAHTENSPIAAFRDRTRPVYGIQWHPEVVHTEKSMKVFKNFTFKVCKCKPNWRMEDFIDKAVDEIKSEADNKRVIVALSGGIDSSTATVLASKSIGKNLTAVFVDHGFMRKGEVESIKNLFQKFDIHFVALNEHKKFFKRLKGIIDPESKRKIIGKEFIRTFEKVAKRVGAEYLLQGTIYPDRIESGYRKHSDRIKTHHNVGGLPTKMKFKKVIEPLRDLYKDEVRRIGKKLGLPEKIMSRQPFPGPGLAVRIVGEVTPQKIEILQEADAIITEEIEKCRLNRNLWQYFGILTDTKTTGVKGDARAYGCTVAIRAVQSKEAMTASFANIPYQILEKISTRITNELSDVTRVVYDITHKPPATIEWE